MIEDSHIPKHKCILNLVKKVLGYIEAGTISIKVALQFKTFDIPYLIWDNLAWKYFFQMDFFGDLMRVFSSCMYHYPLSERVLPT